MVSENLEGGQWKQESDFWAFYFTVINLLINNRTWPVATCCSLNQELFPEARVLEAWSPAGRAIGKCGSFLFSVTPWPRDEHP